ncbi:hypothetical protein PSHT_14560, partial [Puccinia striiformis]
YSLRERWCQERNQTHLSLSAPSPPSPPSAGSSSQTKTFDLDFYNLLLKKTATLFLSGFCYSLFILLLSILLSRMITEHWLWGYNGKWVRPSHYFPLSMGKCTTFIQIEIYMDLVDHFIILLGKMLVAHLSWDVSKLVELMTSEASMNDKRKVGNLILPNLDQTNTP